MNRREFFTAAVAVAAMPAVGLGRVPNRLVTPVESSASSSSGSSSSGSGFIDVTLHSLERVVLPCGGLAKKITEKVIRRRDDGRSYVVSRKTYYREF